MGKSEELKKFEELYRADIREKAMVLLNEEMPAITDELFNIYETTGNRIIFEKVYFRRRKNLAVFGLEALVQIERYGQVQKNILDKLCDVIMDICEEKCWALPPHVNQSEEKWDVTVDLFASGTAQALSELADRLKDTMPCRVYETINRNVERRIFEPFFTSSVPYRNWENSMHNWNGVCAGAIGSACLHLINDKIRLNNYLQRICDCLQYYLMGFADDGTCTEGLSYYTYGMTYFCNFAQELFDKTEGKKDLFRGKWGIFDEKDDKRSKIADFTGKCFFSDGRTLSFADGNNKGTYRLGLSCILAMHYPQVVFPDISRAAGLETDGCYNFVGLKLDLLMPGRMLEVLPGRSDLNDDQLFGKLAVTDILSKAQWVIARSFAGIGMACKGGNNQEFHNHNDIGNFVYEGKGTIFFTDLGSGEYKKGYFGEGRYRVLCNRSLGHSVPIINGKEQLEGRDYRCTAFQVVSQNEILDIKMDITDAYEKGTIRKLERCLTFNLKSGQLQITDEFQMSGDEGECVEENLITQITPVVEENRVVLTAGTQVCILTFQHNNSINILEYEHCNHKGIKEKVYAIRWNVNMVNGAGSETFWLTMPDGRTIS